MKGQVSSEFMMILILVLIISSISIAVVGPDFLFNFKEKDSLEYWSHSPIEVKAHSYDNKTIFIFTNNLRLPINITYLSLGSTSADISSVYLESGVTNQTTSLIVYPSNFYSVSINYSILSQNLSFSGNGVELALIKSE